MYPAYIGGENNKNGAVFAVPFLYMYIRYAAFLISPAF